MLGTAKSDVDEKGFIVHGLLSSLNSSVVWLSIKFIPTKETPEPSFIQKTKYCISTNSFPGNYSFLKVENVHIASSLWRFFTS